MKKTKTTTTKKKTKKQQQQKNMEGPATLGDKNYATTRMRPSTFSL